MISNLPPSGTKVYFTKEVRRAKAFETATLVKAIGKHVPPDRPDDLFEVTFQGETYTVRRDDIAQASEQRG